MWSQNEGHKVKFKKHLVNTLEAIFWAQISQNLVRMSVCIEARIILETGLCGVKK